MCEETQTSRWNETCHEGIEQTRRVFIKSKDVLHVLSLAAQKIIQHSSHDLRIFQVHDRDVPNLIVREVWTS